MSRPYSLMIDPGHGGKDPGAVNSSLDIKEKDIVLSVGLLMRRYVIDRDYLYTPFITRRVDKFVTLRGRCDQAKTLNVDAFLSIHTNARPRKGKPGLEIEAWRAVGSRKGLLFGSSIIDSLLSALGGTIEVYDRGVKEKNFYVLRHTPMPALLIELGFTSDDEEAIFLNNIDSQRVMAKALAEGAEFFLEGGNL